MGRLSVSSARRPGRRHRAAAAGQAGPRTDRAADCGRRHGRPLRRGRERERSCRGKKRAGGWRNARWGSGKTQAGRRIALGGATMKTQEARSGDPAIRRSGDPAIRRSGDPAIRRSGDPAIRRSGDYNVVRDLSTCQGLRAHGDGRAQSADCRACFVEEDHRIVSEPDARPAHETHAHAEHHLFRIVQTVGR